MSDGTIPKQRSPAGWEAYYEKFNIGKDCGKIYYTTQCTCRNSRGPVKKRCSAPHRLRQWALVHGDHRPEYEVMKPRPDEYYPEGGKGRTKHPGYKKYQGRMQSLGFFTSVHMLEQNGFRLPDEAQAKWDHIRGHHASPSAEVMSKDGSDAEVSAEAESGSYVDHPAAEFSSRNGGGTEPSSKEDFSLRDSILHTSRSGRQGRERRPLDGIRSGLHRTPKKARVAAAPSDTEAPTATSSDAPAGPPQHTEQLLKKIRLIQGMLPEYGGGFLAACLRAGGYVVESVVDQLLDGSWKQVPEVRNLDPSMPLQPASRKRRRRAPAGKQIKSPGSFIAGEDEAAPSATAPARSAESPETPDQTKEETQHAAWQTYAASTPEAAVQPGSTVSAHRRVAKRLRLSASGEQVTKICAEGTPGAVVRPGMTPSARGVAASGAPSDVPRSAARLTRSVPDQVGEGVPPAGPRPDQALCRAGPAKPAGPSALEQLVVSGIDTSHLPAAQSTQSHRKGRRGQAGEVMDLSAPVATDCAVASGLGHSGANLGSVDLTPDSPRTSCATQLPAALSNLNVIQGGAVDGDPKPVANQAHYMPATVAILPPAFANPLGAIPANSRAAACTLDDAIADLSTMKAAWDFGAASAGRRFSFGAVLQCLHSARMREGLAQQQEATITRFRADASALEQEKRAVIGRLSARVDTLEDELVVIKRCAEKCESMLASKNREILALRSQVDVYEVS